jgi:small conductance mechanosensitive channel
MFARLGAWLAAAVMIVTLAAGTPLAVAQDAAPAEAPAAAPLTTGEAARALIGILNDEAARAALVGELETLAGPPAAAAPDALPPEAAEEEETLPNVIGRYTLSAAEHVSDLVASSLRALRGLGGLFNGTSTIAWDRVQQIGVGLVIVIVAAFATLYFLRAIAQLGEPPLVRFALRGAWLRRLVATLLMGALGWMLIIASGSAGYAAALLTGDAGRMNILQSLFLNAFVLIETVKLVLRTIVSPRQPALRLVSMSNETASYWTFWLARLIGFLGYGVMLVVPTINMTISFPVGRSIRLLIVLASAVFAIVLVMRNRRRVREGLVSVGQARTGTIRGVFLTLAPIWHLIAILYVVVAFVLWSTRPFDVVGFMVTATAISVVAVSLGLSLINFVNRRFRTGIRLPPQMKEALPRLEERLNLFTPVILGLFRLAVFVAIVAVLLDAWSAVDIAAWVESETGAALLGNLATAGIVALVAVAIWIIATSWIEVWLNPHQTRVPTPRLRTLLSLFRNALTIILAVVTLMLVLSELGLDIAPLLAGAGVLGLAIGFGAQKLVEDIITGAFIQFENAMNEGETVRIGAVTGAVERLTIRSVTLRDGDGVLHVIPFSSVSQIAAMNRGFSFFTADWTVDYRADIAEVKRLMYVAFEAVKDGEFGEHIIDVLEMNGIVELRNTGILVRARIKTTAGNQWGTGRHYMELVKTIFEENGISAIPASRTVVVNEGQEAPQDMPRLAAPEPSPAI